MITDKNALSADVEYVIEANGKKLVLVIETNLQLDPSEIDFDKAAIDALCSELERHRTSNQTIDAVRLVRRRTGSAESIKTTGTLGGHHFKTDRV